MSEPIHLIGLPKKHKLTAGHLEDVLIASPVDGHVLTYEAATSLWKNKPPTGVAYNPLSRKAWIMTFGTTGNDYFGGSGSRVENLEMSLLFSTGTTIGSYAERQWLTWFMDGSQNAEHELLYTEVNTPACYYNKYFIVGNATIASVYKYTDAPTGVRYAGFFGVRDATYTNRYLAVTRINGTVQITDTGVAVSTVGKSMKIIWRQTEVAFYINNVLVATHTTVIPLGVFALRIKAGVSVQDPAADNRIRLHLLRGFGDY